MATQAPDTVPELFGNFEEMTVPLLRQLAKQHKLIPKYVIEEMAENCGKNVKILWLPVAHCELNPIKLIWVKTVQ